MVETRGQQAAREGGDEDFQWLDRRMRRDTNRQTLTSRLTALAIVVPFMAVLKRTKMGLIYIPGVDAWLDPMGATRKPECLYA